ncbi:S8 family serine peptidase [Streptomyces sp. NBC_00094]|uniref:S8 family serine peptidase n=1 Tax=Streptomyces sp. NBC_00094 TaxID=2903620 RepID=UPI002258EC83|nr:S8 family serine peptidase [Streptomyces sp. NBC_00094]MCX5395219.1 S8 family serine peptidase [Streptomyces sp. NBC_00094]
MEYQKLAPLLRIAYKEYLDGDVQTLRRRSNALGFAHVDEAIENSLMLISLECDPGASLDELCDDFGLILRRGSGASIRTGIAPISSISAITDSPSVRYVASSPPLRSKIDDAARTIGINPLRGRGDNPDLDGSNVIVGIIDSGIDAGHPAFQGRIDRVWDQSVPGDGVPGAAYGVELTGPQIHQCRDVDGHGTHVAGIAAGAGLYLGVAPAARLVIVKLPEVKSGNMLLDGVDYIFRYADQVEMPAVVNISLGNHFGPHDGTSHFSGRVNELTEEGRIICCAAGNEGLDVIHSGPTLVDGKVSDVYLHPVKGDTYVSGWYSAEDDIGVSVVSPSGGTTDIEHGQYSASAWTFPDGTVEISRGDGPGGDRSIELVFKNVRPHDFMGTQVVWNIRLHGRAIRKGRVDLWVEDEGGSRFAGPDANSSMTVCQPADANSAVAVAAYTTKVGWTSANGARMKARFKLNDVCDFSSEGPRRDGASKPDVTAPGAVIVSCRSNHAQMDAHSVIDAEHCVMYGTSMAAPFVSGAVALMLQADPTLAPAAVISKLSALSSVPAHPSGTFHPKWGYGLVDLSQI